MNRTNLPVFPAHSPGRHRLIVPSLQNKISYAYLLNRNYNCTMDMHSYTNYSHNLFLYQGCFLAVRHSTDVIASQKLVRREATECCHRVC